MSDGTNSYGFLTSGAIGGLVLLAWYDSLLVGLLVGGVLGWAWLTDWVQGAVCTSSTRLQGKLAVVTGANTGIGLMTARDLATRGARVILACRDLAKGEAAAEWIREYLGTGQAKVEVARLDLSSFSSIRQFCRDLAARETRLDLLVNNAGIMFAPRAITEDGQERTLQTNHLGHFLLTNLLRNLPEAAEKARVVTVSSDAHKMTKGISWEDLQQAKTWNMFEVYGQSKLANIYFSRELSRRFSPSVTTYSLHPGVVNTELVRHGMLAQAFKLAVAYLPGFNKLFKTAEAGAQTSIYCCVEKELDNVTGRYYSDCAETVPTKLAQDDSEAKKLWSVSEEIVGDITPVTSTGATTTTSDSDPTRDSLLKDIQAFPTEGPTLSHVSPKEPVSGAELLQQELGHQAVVEGVENFQREELRHTEVVEKTVLPDAETIKTEKDKFDLLKDVEGFKPTELAHVTTKESLSGPELVKQELTRKAVTESVEAFDQDALKHTEVLEKNLLPDKETLQEEKNRSDLLKGVEEFSTSDLSHVRTQEPASGAELVKQELTHKSVVESVESFDPAGLKHSVLTEKISLPDAETIKTERDRFDLLKGVEEFSSSDLSHVTTKESPSGVEILKQELTRKAVTESVETFDQDLLKHTNVVEKNLLPDKETIQEEKTRSNLLKGVEEFSTSDLSHVQTQEPASGAELLRQELTHKSIVESVESFDTAGLKHSVLTEKVSLPDAETIKTERDRFDLLKGVEEFPASGQVLSPVTPKEPLSGIDLLKQELSHKAIVEGVENFEKDDLKHALIEEKNILPDAETLQTEKQQTELLKGIGDFDSDSLRTVSTREPMTGPDLVRQESLRTTITDQIQAFDRSDLKETDTDEKVILPGVEELKSEKQHQDMLESVEKGVELKHVETMGPTTPVDIARLEMARDNLVDNIHEFDRTSLVPVTTEERNLLPTVDDLKLSSSEDEERNTRSSSEEWEKIGHSDEEKNVSYA